MSALEEVLADLSAEVDQLDALVAAVPAGELPVRWRTARAALPSVLRRVPSSGRLPWFGPPMSATSMATARFMETWAHGQDVAEGLGVELQASDRVRHVVHRGLRTRGFSYCNRGLEPPVADVRLRLRLPGSAVLEAGPEDAGRSVTGTARTPAWSPPFLRQARAGARTTGLWHERGRHGFLGVAVPEEYGGGGGGIGDLAAVCEELAPRGCPLLMMVVSPAICGTVVGRFGTPEQRLRRLPGRGDGPAVRRAQPRADHGCCVRHRPG